MVKRQRGTSSDIAAVLLTFTMCISSVSQTETSGACTGHSSLETSGTTESSDPYRFFLQISSLPFREQSPKRICPEIMWLTWVDRTAAR